MSEKNKKLCANCDDCCRYIAVGIDKPTVKKDFENIMWFLLHENVKVYVDWENDWYLEFATPCKELNKNSKLCNYYSKRPQICREYKQEDCTHYNHDSAEKISFNGVEDLKKYLAERKKKSLARKKKLAAKNNLPKK
jgi:Fe-S-cluster containining protein